MIIVLDRFLKKLVHIDVLTQQQARDLMKESQETKKSTREIVLDNNILSEEELMEAISSLYKIPKAYLYEETVPLDVCHIFKADLLRSSVAFAFGFDEEDPNTIYVAFQDPLDMKARDMISVACNRRVRPFVATATDIRNAIDRYYGTEEMKEVVEQYTTASEIDLSIEEQIIQEDINSSPLVILVNSMIEKAIRQRASDIHVEASADNIRVRYRVDGVLYTDATYSSKLLSAILARIKVISGLDISEKHKPQDGRFSFSVDRREYDIRVSTLPTVFGEKCVMRLAMKKVLHQSKEQLGLSGAELERFDRILKRPHGIVLVTGPTGSGKSTTLYTALNELNSDMVNIVTVEDPVEANIDGINQVQVNPKAQLTFANALRSILRQDPDIIMIGEIRDSETAAIAVQASITGHLVVSTLHTNDTASSITRLLDMGIESYLIADSVVGIVAQRLVRRLCPYCKKEHLVTTSEAAYLGVEEGTTIYTADGCQRCGNTGYHGRIGVYEIMEITPQLAEMISNRESADNIREEAVQEGMFTLKQSAREFVLKGTTSLSEMQRITAEKFELYDEEENTMEEEA